MAHRSVTNGVRRLTAPYRSNCAPLALTVGILLSASQAYCQSPSLGPASNSDARPSQAQSQAVPVVPPQPHPDDKPKTSNSAPLPPPSSPGSAVGSTTPSTTKPSAGAGLQKPSSPKESEELAVALERPGDLNLHGLSLNAALFTIGEQWNINIVSGDLQGNVNGSFKQAPLREILDAI